ncbi:MAG: hypothetical protein QCH35_03240 [Methanomicrobiaceae archaeon]|nr:hypothetical protein [Methanomicrobiaceae archaeon]
MANREIDSIKQIEADSLSLLQKEREEAEKRIRDAERNAEELIRRRQHEAHETVLRMKVEAEEAAIAEAEKIRREGEKKVEEMKKHHLHRLSIAVKSILMHILGENSAVSANDETGISRVAPGVPE